MFEQRKVTGWSFSLSEWGGCLFNGSILRFGRIHVFGLNEVIIVYGTRVHFSLRTINDHLNIPKNYNRPPCSLKCIDFILIGLNNLMVMANR